MIEHKYVEMLETETEQMRKEFRKLLSDFQFANQWPLAMGERICHFYLGKDGKTVRHWYDIVKEELHLFDDFNPLYMTPDVANELKDYVEALRDYLDNHKELDRDVMGTLNPFEAFNRFCEDLEAFADKYPSKELQDIDEEVNF